MRRRGGPDFCCGCQALLDATPHVAERPCSILKKRWFRFIEVDMCALGHPDGNLVGQGCPTPEHRPLNPDWPLLSAPPTPSPINRQMVTLPPRETDTLPFLSISSSQFSFSLSNKLISQTGFGITKEKTKQNKTKSTSHSVPCTLVLSTVIANHSDCQASPPPIVSGQPRPHLLQGGSP